ncbi:DUF2790 domain-containing protein [Pseudomonas sp. NPDC007930]|uniref:DUF2790 domain-containing protein n=1 Tax=Pseudomonas sp. NPDC007930 TaxID=3364417 RepID=UPI0036F1194A
MKVALWAFAFCGLSSVALADQPSAEPAVEHYHYGMALDIAQVVARDKVPAVCAVVPVRMTYLDSQQQRHVLEYLVMGDGCGNG